MRSSRAPGDRCVEDVRLHGRDPGLGVELLGGPGVEPYPAGDVRDQAVPAGAHHGHRAAAQGCMRGQRVAEVAPGAAVAQQYQRLRARSNHAAGQGGYHFEFRGVQAGGGQHIGHDASQFSAKEGVAGAFDGQRCCRAALNSVATEASASGDPAPSPAECPTVAVASCRLP